jgi:hypothetical protein
VNRRSKPQQDHRIAFAFISLFLIVFGLGILLNHRIEYANYWGGMVFAPFAILIGVTLLFIVLFRPGFFRGTTEQKHRRIRGWPRTRNPR